MTDLRVDGQIVSEDEFRAQYAREHKLNLADDGDVAFLDSLVSSLIIAEDDRRIEVSHDARAHFDITKKDLTPFPAPSAKEARRTARRSRERDLY